MNKQMIMKFQNGDIKMGDLHLQLKSSKEVPLGRLEKFDDLFSYYTDTAREYVLDKKVYRKGQDLYLFFKTEGMLKFSKGIILVQPGWWEVISV